MGLPELSPSLSFSNSNLHAEDWSTKKRTPSNDDEVKEHVPRVAYNITASTFCESWNSPNARALKFRLSRPAGGNARRQKRLYAQERGNEKKKKNHEL